MSFGVFSLIPHSWRLSDLTGSALPSMLLESSTRPAEFVANHAAQGSLEPLLFLAHVNAQSFIDGGLVISSACVVHLLAKPVQNVVVQPNRDSSLFRRVPVELIVQSSVSAKGLCTTRTMHMPPPRASTIHSVAMVGAFGPQDPSFTKRCGASHPRVHSDRVILRLASFLR